MSKTTDQEKKDFRSALRSANIIQERENDSGYDNYGICSSCSYFSYREYELGHRILAKCTHHSVENYGHLHDNLRITRCNDYCKKGQMSLETMWMIAKFINIDKKTGPIGFTTSELREEDLYPIPYSIGEEIDD